MLEIVPPSGINKFTSKPQSCIKAISPIWVCECSLESLTSCSTMSRLSTILVLKLWCSQFCSEGSLNLCGEGHKGTKFPRTHNNYYKPIMLQTWEMAVRALQWSQNDFLTLKLGLLGVSFLCELTAVLLHGRLDYRIDHSSFMVMHWLHRLWLHLYSHILCCNIWLTNSSWNLLSLRKLCEVTTMYPITEFAIRPEEEGIIVPVSKLGSNPVFIKIISQVIAYSQVNDKVQVTGISITKTVCPILK